MPRKAAIPPLSEQQAAQGGVASVDRALSLLDAFTTTHPMLTLSELAERTTQYKSTVLRLLASLEHSHLVRRLADGRFTLGSAVARLHVVYTASFSIGDVVLPALQELVAETRESASFHVEQAGQDLCLYRVDSPHPVRDHLRAGEMRPMKSSIGGQVLLAYTARGGARSARIRQRQLLLANGDIVPELGAVAAPAFGPGARLVGALVLTMPAVRWVPSHAPAVQRIARKITQQLGGVFPAPP